MKTESSANIYPAMPRPGRKIGLKRGKPVAKLVPVEQEKDEIFGFFKGKGKILGDVVAPAFSPDEWDTD